MASLSILICLQLGQLFFNLWLLRLLATIAGSRRRRWRDAGIAILLLLLITLFAFAAGAVVMRLPGLVALPLIITVITTSLYAFFATLRRIFALSVKRALIVGTTWFGAC